jgi:hypothetical protein
MMKVEHIIFRMNRAYEMLAKGEEPTTLGKDVFSVPSQSGKGSYKVSIIDGEWHCECPDCTYRHLECKHIFAVKFWLAVRKKMEKSSILNLTQETLEAKHCRFCGSPLIIKQGTRRCRFGIKQVYLCKDCRKKFVPEDTFQRMQFDP